MQFDVARGEARERERGAERERRGEWRSGGNISKKSCAVYCYQRSEIDMMFRSSTLQGGRRGNRRRERGGERGGERGEQEEWAGGGNMSKTPCAVY